MTTKQCSRCLSVARRGGVHTCTPTAEWAALEAERDALRAALERLLDADHAMAVQVQELEDDRLMVWQDDWDEHCAVVRETRALLAARSDA